MKHRKLSNKICKLRNKNDLNIYLELFKVITRKNREELSHSVF